MLSRDEQNEVAGRPSGRIAAFGWGLTGIWTGLSLFMVLRLAAVLARWRSGNWAVTGAIRPA